MRLREDYAALLESLMRQGSAVAPGSRSGADRVREMPKLVALAVRRGATNPPGRSQVHGEEHWKAVALMGFWLAERTAGVDREFILTFAQLHDVMRESDGLDPEHGERAAGLFRRLCRDPGVDGFAPSSSRTLAMCYALAHHTSGKRADTVANVNVGVCWDAARLNLERVGITPNPAFLTTEAGRSVAACETAGSFAGLRVPVVSRRGRTSF